MYDDFYDFDEPQKRTIEDLSFSEQVDLILKALWDQQYREWDDGESDRRLYGEEDLEFDESTLVPQKYWITAKMNNNRVVNINWVEKVSNRPVECSAFISRYENGYRYTVQGSGGLGSSLADNTIITLKLPGYESATQRAGDEYAFIDWGSADPLI